MRAIIIRPGVGGYASLESLRRRPYLRVVPLPLGWALVIGGLDL